MRVSAQRPVILAVDDDDGIHETYRFIFEDQYEVLSATDGPQALKIVQSSPVDLMLLDLPPRLYRQIYVRPISTSFRQLCAPPDERSTRLKIP